MGRIKTTYIKRIGRKLYEKHSDNFKKDFEGNKKIVNDLVNVKSKKLRNILAGYITRLKKS